MKYLAWMIPGLVLPLMLPVLPGKFFSFLLIVVLLAIAIYRKQPSLIMLLTGIAWTLIHLHHRLDQRLDPARNDYAIVSGYVADLPVRRGDMLEFRFRITDPLSSQLSENSELLLRWYRDFPKIRAGEYWQLHIRIKPSRSRVNFAGPDRERWYFAQGISALGVVKPGQSQFLGPASAINPQAWRQKTRNRIIAILADHEARPLILALALADRSEISKESWSRFRLTGTSHLLAISGMHVGLSALMGFWLGRLMMIFIPVRFALAYGLRLSWLSSISLAAYYSMMAGLGTSTRRALLMILAFYLVSLLKRSVAPWQGLTVALAFVLLLNPLAPLGAGFWFSFMAVSVLLCVFTSRHGNGHWLGKMMLAQAGLTVVMMPVGMLWFQQVTLVGLVSNLVAIPWISFAVIPATLLAILALPLESWLAPFLLFSAAESVSVLESLLHLMEKTGKFAWFATDKPALAATILSTIGGLLLLLPRAIPTRLLGLLLLLPLGFPARQNKNQLLIEMLDVGQGLAILVETENHLLLYDTGPGDNQSWSLVSQVISPAITSLAHSAPERLIVSHGDLDHAGGLSEVQNRYPSMRILANLRTPGTGVLPCRVPRKWNWDGASFEVLHPAVGLPYLGNDSSCVLAIGFYDRSVLLTGDIGSAVESRLIKNGLGEYNYLFAPHHGSKSSSSRAFLIAVKPEAALISTAYHNQFNFPHSDVLERFAEHDTVLWNTAECGAIRIILRADAEPYVESARRHESALWRWPPEADCP